MKVAVTGGAGYIGSTLMMRLLEEGYEAVSIDNLSRGDYSCLRGLEGPMELLIADVRDKDLLRETFKGVEVIVHLAAIPGLRACDERPQEAISVNIYGTLLVLEAAIEADVQRLIFASSAAVYGVPRYLPVDEEHPLKPLNLYGVTKLAGERLVEAYHQNHGLEAVILRLGNVFGVGLYTRWDTVIPKFVKQGLRSEPLTIYGDGHSSRDFVHVEDVVEAILLSLRGDDGFEVYNVGGEPMEVGQVAEIVWEEIEEATGKRVGVTHLPPRRGETKCIEYNTTKIRRRLGYRPQWSVRMGVRQLIEYALKLGEGD
jgi:UDP-glucose 4-epimerase